MVIKVAVLGAGINGLASAVKIKEKYQDYKVVIIADEFSPNTTGDGSGGLWFPYLFGKTAKEHITKWGLETYNFLHQLWQNGGNDICLMPFFNLYREANCQAPDWAHDVFGYQALDEKYLKYIRKLYSTDFASGYTFSTFISTPTTLINHLMYRFKSLNGETLQAKFSSLEDPILGQFDVVVNCLGLSAKTVVPDDGVYPIRGQISKVKAPWINEAVIDDEGGNYILPNVYACAIGGTHQENDYNKSLNDEDTAFIFNGCQRMVPSFKHARILTNWVGLRPGRDAVRVEAERRDGKLFIHNYGHGGCGLTLFWGCATEVLQLLENNLNKNNMCKL